MYHSLLFLWWNVSKLILSYNVKTKFCDGFVPTKIPPLVDWSEGYSASYLYNVL